MKTLDTTQFVYEQAEKASLEWYKAQSLNPYAQIYLYYKSGELGAFEDPPEGWTLGRQARLSPACTRQQIKSQIVESAQRLPFLPV